jgi:dihydroflavonol-4-reductase
MGGRSEHRILITGGTGFIGSRLSRAALERGWSVFLLTRQPESARARTLALSGARLLLGDVLDRASVRAAFEIARPETVFHLAGWYELGIGRASRRRMRAVNVDGVEVILSQAAEWGARRTVYVSSTTALGDTGGRVEDETFTRRAAPYSWYENTKTEAHRLALRHQQEGEPVIIVAPAQVVGPGDHSPFGIMGRLYLRGRLPPVGWGPRGAFTFAHVEDVAQGVLAAATGGKIGQLYFLAGETLSVAELMEVWRTVGRRRPIQIWLPRPLALAQAAIAAPVLRMMGQPAFLSGEVVRSGYASFRYTSQKAIGELGVTFRPAELAWKESLEEEAALIRGGRSEARW